MSLASTVKSAMGALGSDFVREGTIERVATGGYNPSTGKAGSQIIDTSIVRGPVENYSSREIDGTTVLRGDLKWTVPADGIDEVRTNDLVDFGEETPSGGRIRYTVIDPYPIYAGERVAVYQLQLRR